MGNPTDTSRLNPVAIGLGTVAGVGAPIALMWNLSRADDLGELVAAVWFLPAPVAIGAGLIAGLAASVWPGTRDRATGSIYSSVLTGAALGTAAIGLVILVWSLIAGEPVSGSALVGVTVIGSVMVAFSAIGAGLGMLLATPLRGGLRR